MQDYNFEFPQFPFSALLQGIQAIPFRESRSVWLAWQRMEIRGESRSPARFWDRPTFDALFWDCGTRSVSF